MGCCNSCDEGHGCEGEMKSPRGSVPPGVIIPGPDPVTPVIEAPLMDESALPSGPLGPSFSPEFSLSPGRQIEVASDLGLGQSEVTASEPYEVGACNSLRIEVVLLSVANGAVTVTVEASVDRQNWLPQTRTLVQSLGFASWPLRGFSSRYVRLRYAGDSTANFRATLAAALRGGKGGNRMGGFRNAV
jgi:hypothetical protein